MYSLHKVLTFVTAVLLLLEISASIAEAGSSKRRGTAGAQELLIPVGSRGTALVGANQAMAYGTEAIFWNPAGIGRTTAKAEAMFSTLDYIAGINLTYLAAMTNFPGIGAFAFSLRNLDFGDIPVTTEEMTDGTGEMFSPSYITAGISYSRVMTDRIAIGVTGKVVSESIMRENARGFALDIGVQYSTGAGGYRLGVVLKNLGPNMKFDGPDLEERHQPTDTEPETNPEPRRITLQSFELPATLELGLGYELLFGGQNSLTLAGDFVNNNFSLDEIKLGAEYSLNDIIFVRGGYKIGYNSDPLEEEIFTDLNGNGEWDYEEPYDDVNSNGRWDQSEDSFATGAQSFIWGPSFGAGLKYDLTPDMTMSFDYAYQVAEFFNDNQWFTLTVSF